MTQRPIQWQILILHSASREGYSLAVDVAHSFTNKSIREVLKPHGSPYVMDTLRMNPNVEKNRNIYLSVDSEF